MDAKTLLHRLLQSENRTSVRRMLTSIVLCGYMLTGIVSPNIFSIFNSQFSIPSAEAATGINKIIHYQGKVNSLGGSAIANGSYNMRFKIYDALTAGNILWSETWSNSTTRVTMTGGLFSVGLGTHITMTGAVNFNTDNLYLQVEFDPGNDGTYEETFAPRRRFAAVPYAHNADALDGLDSSKFVRKDQAETMSGTLTVKPNSAATIGINIISTAGSNTVPGLKISTQGANHILFGSGASVYDVNLYRFTANVLKTDDNFYAASLSGSTLEILGAMSGATIHAEKSLTSSGTLVWEGAASGSSLYIASSLEGAGLSDCDTPTTSKLLWDATTKRFSCGSDQAGVTSAPEVGTASFSGAVIRIADARYLKLSGGTLTGALSIQNGSTHAATGTPLLNVRGTISGSTLYGARALRSSGSLVWEGQGSGASLYIASSLQGAGLSDCDTPTTSKLLWDATSGRFSCGTDQSGSAAPEVGTAAFSGGVIRIADARYLKLSGGTLTGALTIQNGNTHSAVGTPLLNVRGTMSGMKLFGMDSITSSGILVIESRTAVGSGAVTIMAAENQSGAYITSSGAALLVLDAASKTSSTKHILFGYRGTFDTNLYRLAASTLKTDGTFVAGTTLASSGTLIWEGAASGASLYLGTSLEGAGLSDCDNTTTSKLLWDATTKRFSCGTDQTGGGSTQEVGTASFSGGVIRIGDARYVNTSGDTMTGTLTITPVAFQSALVLNGTNLTTTDVASIGGTSLTSGDAFQITVDQSMTSGKAFRIIGAIKGGTTGDVFTVNSSGALGIGTSSPSTSLDVSGINMLAKTGSGLSVASGLADIALQGNYAYMIDGAAGTLYVADISSTTPVLISTTDTVSLSSIVVSGKYAYAGNSSNTYIYDISNPAAPTQMGICAMASANGLAVQGRYAYGVNASGVINICDVGTPTTPVIVGTKTIGTLLQDIVVQGKYAYTVDYSANMLYVVNVENVTDPTVAGSVATTHERSSRLVVQGSYVYVGNGNDPTDPSGVIVYNISDPSSPVAVATWQDISINCYYPLGAAGRYLYVGIGCSGESVVVLDISDPTAPTDIADLGFSSSISIGAIRGHYGYIIDDAGMLQTIELGGAYIQGLEAGSMQTDSLDVLNRFSAGQADIFGGLSVGASLNVNGNAAISGSLLAHNLAFKTASGSAITIMGGNSYLLGSVGIGTATVDTGLKLEVAGAMSGTSLYIKTRLASSGTLTVEGQSYLEAASNVNLLENGSISFKMNITSGVLGILSNGTGIPSISLGSVSSTPLYVRDVSGAGTIGIRTIPNNAGAAMEINGTASGTSFFARTSLRSSGSLVWEGAGSGSSLDLGGGNVSISSTGSAVFNVLNRNVDFVIKGQADSTLFVADASANKVGIGTATPGSKLSVSGAMIINPNGNLGSSAADAGIALEVIGTMSGRSLRISGTGASPLIYTDTSITNGTVNIGATTQSGIVAGTAKSKLYIERPSNLFGMTIAGASGQQADMILQAGSGSANHKKLQIASLGNISAIRALTDTNTVGSTFLTMDHTTGNTGIGGTSTTAGFKLQSNGNISMIGNTFGIQNTSAPDGRQVWQHLISNTDGTYNIGPRTDALSAGSLSNAPFRISTNSTINTLVLSGSTAGIGTISIGSLTQSGIVAGNTKSRLYVSRPNGLFGMTIAGESGIQSDFIMQSGNGAANSKKMQFVLGSGFFTMRTLTDANGVGFNILVANHATGDVGIGTSAPESRLQVTGGGLCVGSDANCNTDNDTEGVVYSSSTAMSVYDVAEMYPTTDLTLTGADIVSLDPNNGVFVKRAEPGDARILGIVSAKPAVVLGGFNGEQFQEEHQVAIALSGRVPVGITTEGGPVAIGDELTLSSQAGIARKAKGGEQTIGYALESFSGSGIGSILVFVRTGNVLPATISESGAKLVVSATDNDNATLLRLDSEETNGNQNMLQIVSDVGGNENTVMRVNASGAVYSDSTFNSSGADYAEWFYSSDKLTKGETVCIDINRSNAVKRCDRDADSNIMGIVSTNPAFIGNSIGGADGIIPPGYALIGLIGQVPAKVTAEGGAIRPGDSLTAATKPGYARKANAGESTVGVALEGLENGEGVVNVLISRRNQSLTVEAVEEKVLNTIASMEIEDEVQIMVSAALGDLNVDEQISEEVERQLQDMQSNVIALEALRSELNALKAELAILKSQTGSSVTVIAQTGSYSRAASLEIDTTLTTGGDTRIGGDLYIDGTLNASSLFVPNGLSIDGGVTMSGLLDTAELRVSSGATVDGILTVNGALVMGSGGYLNFASGALSIGQLVVHDSLYVMGDITIDGLARFMGDVEITGELIVSGKQAGFAMIPQDASSVTVTFGTGFRATPVITASPDVPVLYGVWKSSGTGFTIRLAEPAMENITFSWHALSTLAPTTLTANLTDSALIAFPTDDSGVPVSSSMVWNACIRNITLMDESGQPLSCSRYHDAYTWTHPDLNIDFLWNTSLNPPLLKLPEGYEATMTENAEDIRASFGTTDENIAEEETEPIEPVTEPETPTEPAVAASSSSTSSEQTSSSPEQTSSTSSAPVVFGPETPTVTTGEPAEGGASSATTSDSVSSVENTPAEEPIDQPVPEEAVETGTDDAAVTE